MRATTSGSSRSSCSTTRCCTGATRSPARARFLLGCLRALDADLRARGSGLVVRHGAPEDEVVAVARGGRRAGRAVDQRRRALRAAARPRVTEALREAGVEAEPHGGGYLVDPSRPRTQGGKPYTVFTPFWRAIAERAAPPVHRAPTALPPLPPSLRKGRHPVGRGAERRRRRRPRAGRRARRDRGPRGAGALAATADLDRYADRHDALSTGGTSVLSPYLRWGCLSARECEERAQRPAAPARRRSSASSPGATSTPISCCMYPEQRRDRSSRSATATACDWADDAEALAAWKAGRTGYPLVDAGMRQLAQTGWMHNRARLVVGSFLTKDLHIDWREGERHFARLLLDGEPAQNNGNWQWIASVGVDPAPYFRRLFNPMLQQRKFDPDGRYVRRWVPELARRARRRARRAVDDERRRAGARRAA